MTRHGYHMFFFIQYSYMGQNIILEDNDIHLLTLLSSDTETVMYVHVKVTLMWLSMG